ncbi:MAG TPA: hypothetical protein DCX03_11225, partial [Bacteroidales bacterium]|nr:hypothetical protein [Bacteroidales bacterium]
LQKKCCIIKIFLSDELFDNFSKIDNLLIEALRERELTENSDENIRPSKTFTKLNDEISPLVEVIESQIQERLHYSDTP